MKIKEKYNMEDVVNIGFYETSFLSSSRLGLIQKSAVGGRIKFYENEEIYNKTEQKGMSAGNYIPNVDELMDGINVTFDNKMKIKTYEENISNEEFKTFLNVLFNYKTDFIEKGHYDSKKFEGTDWKFNIKFKDGTNLKVTGFHDEPEELMNIRKLFNIYGCKFNIPMEY